MSVIRPAVVADVEACLALASGMGGAPTNLAGDLEDAERLLVVAEDAGRVIGYGRAMLFRPAADAPADSAPVGHYLVGLMVDASRRRQGVGSELTSARLDWVFGRAREAWYFSNARNTASIALHARFGFREVTRDFSFPGVGFDGGEGILFRCTANLARQRVLVSGRVQGVWFRESARRRAEHLDLAGWVQNTNAGAVEAVFEGPMTAVDEMVHWCRMGPADARVDDVLVFDEEPEGLRGFEIR